RARHRSAPAKAISATRPLTSLVRATETASVWRQRKGAKHVSSATWPTVCAEPAARHRRNAQAEACARTTRAARSTQALAAASSPTISVRLFARRANESEPATTPYRPQQLRVGGDLVQQSERILDAGRGYASAESRGR